MDIGKIKGHYTFYEGYEGESQIILSIYGEEDIHVHFWDGYFEDLFGNPPLDGAGWSGFTKDYNQLEWAFSPAADCVEIVPDDYLSDALSCVAKTFSYEETSQARELLCEFLQYAVEKTVVVSVE